MQLRDKLFIGGRWVPSAADALLDVDSASTEQVIARVPAGSRADVDRAVAAARVALERWSATAPGERAADAPTGPSAHMVARGCSSAGGRKLPLLFVPLMSAVLMPYDSTALATASAFVSSAPSLLLA